MVEQTDKELEKQVVADKDKWRLDELEEMEGNDYNWDALKKLRNKFVPRSKVYQI